jgi:anti-anti-sigma regulatory factor
MSLPPCDDRPGAIVVTIGGEQSPQEMRMMTLVALTGAPRDLVLDLRTADRVSDLELSLLVGVRARQRARGRTLTLVSGPESTTREALSRAGLGDQFTTVTALPADARVAVRAQRWSARYAQRSATLCTAPGDAPRARRDASRERS